MWRAVRSVVLPVGAASFSFLEFAFGANKLGTAPENSSARIFGYEGCVLCARGLLVRDAGFRAVAAPLPVRAFRRYEIRPIPEPPTSRSNSRHARFGGRTLAGPLSLHAPAFAANHRCRMEISERRYECVRTRPFSRAAGFELKFVRQGHTRHAHRRSSPKQREKDLQRDPRIQCAKKKVAMNTISAAARLFSVNLDVSDQRRTIASLLSRARRTTPSGICRKTDRRFS